MGILIAWLVVTVSMLVADRLLDGMKIKGGLGSHLFVAALFGILNALLGTALYLAIGIGTLGLGFLLSFFTRWLISAALLKLASALTHRLTLRDFRTALVAALIMSLTASVTETVLHQLRWS